MQVFSKARLRAEEPLTPEEIHHLRRLARAWYGGKVFGLVIASAAAAFITFGQVIAWVADLLHLMKH
jgi:hypothetical protein